jgi:hypothetical protein
LLLDKFRPVIVDSLFVVKFVRVVCETTTPFPVIPLDPEVPEVPEVPPPPPV